MKTRTTCSRCGTVTRAGVARGLCPRCLLEAGRSGWSREDAAPPYGFELPSPHELAERFPAYEIFGLIGRGGMGAVYRGRHKELERDVALKILRPEIAEQPDLRERFTREARALARLSHPGIVGVHDFGVKDGMAYVVMEFVDGPNLRQILRAGKLPPEDALALVPQVCEALQYAHDAGVVHRDVKPENVLIDGNGRVKMADFGLAKLTNTTTTALTQANQVMGTPHYMAPEQVDSTRNVDHRADIYSLGIVLYELLTGELPLGRFDPPSMRAGIDAHWDDVVLKSLESQPERRYQHASDVRDALDRVAAGERPAQSEERVTLDEDLVGTILTVAALGLAAIGLVIGEKWWAVLALYLPGMAVGSCMVYSKLTRSDRLAAIGFLVVSLGLIGYGMLVLNTARPMWGLLAFVIGMGHGMEEQKRKEADTASE